MNNLLPPVWGCEEDEPDKRDKRREDIMGAAPSNMPDWDVGYDVEEAIGAIRNDHQGYSLGCTTFGLTNDVETQYNASTGIIVNLSPGFVYPNIRSKNGGANPRTVYKYAHKNGICEEQFDPHNYGWDLTEIELTNTKLLPGAMENAAKYKIGAYMSISSLDMDTLAQIIFEDNGVGAAYRAGGRMGHFIFDKGYGLYKGKYFNGKKAIKIKDSYDPYEKWIVKDGNQFYLINAWGNKVAIQMYSSWTAQPNPAWHKEMPTRLVRKINTKEVFLEANNERRWIKEAPDFEDLRSIQPIKDIEWKNIEEVDKFETPFKGRIYGKANFADIIKSLFGLK